ncbi:phosphate uptake regulator PhoU [Ignisphaera sp. 4213-co]|uniref:Phosphate uptake regulator PhoU n=1 Tax=Ignisphaera cupida TaxID=3050454 RepID=A0ABD4Z489_9CREN|nr:phosphate uptake regulator PhoU [Ignisphaera sp. 4213-co]MDK6028019.1 phosphate uptake regulator PhoU [Ignisphaera sp. 4213-co]
MEAVLTNVRKVIRIGERSIGITIPKEWLPILGISVGASVEVTLGPGYLLVKPLSTIHPKITQSIKIKHEDEETLSRLIIASYIEGFDVISIDESKDIARRSFQKISTRLPGAIAMEGATFRLKISVDEFNTDLEEVIGAMRTTLSMMFDLLIDYFTSGDKSKLDEVIRLDDDLDRLHFLGMRTIKRTAFRDPSQAINNSIIIKSLEHIGDTLDRVSNTILRLGFDTNINAKCREVFKDMFSKVSSYVSKAVNALASSNISLIMKVLIGREELSKEILGNVTQCIEAPGVLAIAHEAIVAVYEAAEIAEVATIKALMTIGKPETVLPKVEIPQEPSE